MISCFITIQIGFTLLVYWLTHVVLENKMLIEGL